MAGSRISNFMSNQAPMKERLLVWQTASTGKGFACTRCSWTYPNPEKLPEQEHDASQVQRRFAEHICHHELPLKKFNWS
jgi:hypothetical protein